MYALPFYAGTYSACDDIDSNRIISTYKKKITISTDKSKF